MNRLVSGLAEPAHDAQRLFRAVLKAFYRPGRIVDLPDPLAGPTSISPATTAFLLTLADRDTPLWLASQFDSVAVRDFLRFHTGALLTEQRAQAAFGVMGHDVAAFEGFAVGTDAYPDRSATLLIEVPALGRGPTRTWRGPGIDGAARVAVDGPNEGFWQAWADNHTLFPCGVDIVFAAGSQLLALPRSVAVEG